MVDEQAGRWLTVRQVAQRLQLNERTILRAIHSGQLQAAKFGRKGGWRIAPADVERWIASRQSERHE
jgi:excisionase family DNA binding protein